MEYAHAPFQANFGQQGVFLANFKFAVFAESAKPTNCLFALFLLSPFFNG